MLSQEQQLEIENLQKLRSTLQAIKLSTDKILLDIKTVHQHNYPHLEKQAKDLDSKLDTLY